MRIFLSINISIQNGSILLIDHSIFEKNNNIAFHVNARGKKYRFSVGVLFKIKLFQFNE